jgi:hypothetical protein
VTVPHEPPWTLTPDEDPRGRELDALRTLALRMRDQDPELWPHLLLLLGDQVYADEMSPLTRAYVERRRDRRSEAPEDCVLGFEEYTRLYREAWSEEVIRWLLSTVSTGMIFDDHDFHDDWNISAAWVEEMEREPWWQEHVVGGLMSYWLYQHVGNLSPHVHEDEEILHALREADDGESVLHDLGRRVNRDPDAYRWSWCRDIGGTRLVVIDSRAGRVLEEGRRSMLDRKEWAWVEEQLAGDVDHLLVGTSLPYLLAPGMHHLEAFSEAVCGGAFGDLAARAGERMRQSLDLEHWAAFEESFRRVAELLRAAGAGERGEPPASIVALSGDIHHADLYEVGFRPGSGVRSAVWQAICSPLRNPLSKRERRAIHFADSRPFEAAFGALARTAGVEPLPIGWRRRGDGPFFDNAVATLEASGRRIELEVEKAIPGDDGVPQLERVIAQRLA